MARRRHPRDRVGTFWNPAGPAEVSAEQGRVRTAQQSVNAGLKSKPPTGDPAEVDAAVRAWNGVDARASLYVNEDPSAFWWTRDTQVDTGKTLEAEIESWRAKFASLGAGVPAASAVPAAPAGSSDPLGLGNVADTLKWGAIAFIAYKLFSK